MVTEVAKSPSYPFFFMIGISSEPIDEVSAAEDPEIPPKNMLASTLTIANPPRKRPTKALASPTRRAEMPPAPMISPAMMKNGTASKTKTSIPRTIP